MISCVCVEGEGGWLEGGLRVRGHKKHLFTTSLYGQGIVCNKKFFCTKMFSDGPNKETKLTSYV